MAEELQETPTVIRGRPANYPWEQWMNGSWWVAKQGEDFACSVKSFQTGLHVKGRSTGKKVTTSIEEDKVTFQFHE